MAIKLKIKKGDTVRIIAGDDKGKTGEVLQVLPKVNKVIVNRLTITPKTREFIAIFSSNPPFIAKTAAIVIGGIATSINVTFTHVSSTP